MRLAPLVAAVLALGQGGTASSQSLSEDPQPLACVSSRESRDLFVAKKLAQPFRVMKDTATSASAEAIDIQLCRFGSNLVYDVTLLNQEGRVFHRLVSAVTGAAINAQPPGK